MLLSVQSSYFSDLSPRVNRGLRAGYKESPQPCSHPQHNAIHLLLHHQVIMFSTFATISAAAGESNKPGPAQDVPLDLDSGSSDPAHPAKGPNGQPVCVVARDDIVDESPFNAESGSGSKTSTCVVA
jgi:hypothetical protein